MGAVVTVTDSTQRRTPKAAKTTSVFKKAVMAISGIVLVLYLIAHMIGNLKAFAGADEFNHYSEWLRTIGNPALPGATALWLIRIILLVAVVAHIWAAAVTVIPDSRPVSTTPARTGRCSPPSPRPASIPSTGA